MKISKILSAFVLMFILTTSTGCALLQLGKPWSPIDSQYVTIRNGGIFVSNQTKSKYYEGRLGLELMPKTTDRLYVEVQFISLFKNQDCKVTKKVAGSPVLFDCPQTNFIQDEQYPVEINVYGDKNKKKKLETIQTNLTFKEQKVDEVISTVLSNNTVMKVEKVASANNPKCKEEGVVTDAVDVETTGEGLDMRILQHWTVQKCSNTQTYEVIYTLGETGNIKVNVPKKPVKK